MQLPELALPDQGLWSVARDGATRDKDERDDEDAGDRDDSIEDEEQPRGAGLMLCVREAGGMLVDDEGFTGVDIKAWCSTHEILGSVRENGRLLGEMYPRASAMRPKPTTRTQSRA